MSEGRERPLVIMADDDIEIPHDHESHFANVSL